MNPIRDNTFYIDNSAIELITTCPWLAYASIIRRRRPATESAALRFGGFLHQVLDYRYHQIALNLPWTEDQMITLASKLFGDSPLETEGWRNFDSAVKVIRAYNRRYPQAQETSTIPVLSNRRPYVEMPFAVDTHKTIRGVNIIYTGRIDLNEIEPDGSAYIVAPT